MARNIDRFSDALEKIMATVFNDYYIRDIAYAVKHFYRLSFLPRYSNANVCMARQEPQ